MAVITGILSRAWHGLLSAPVRSSLFCTYSTVSAIKWLRLYKRPRTRLKPPLQALYKPSLCRRSPVDLPSFRNFRPHKQMKQRGDRSLRLQSKAIIRKPSTPKVQMPHSHAENISFVLACHRTARELTDCHSAPHGDRFQGQGREQDRETPLQIDAEETEESMDQAIDAPAEELEVLML